MGNWGTKIYQDDLALDIKESYTENLKSGLSDKETLKQIIKENKEVTLDEDERSIFWMALADTMWNLGRLTQEIKENALNSIEENLKIWENQASKKEYESRRKELEKLKEKLQSQMPEKKKIDPVNKTTKTNKTTNIWKVGEIYAYQLTSEEAEKNNIKGRYLLLRKARETEPGEGRTQVVYCQITKDCKLPKTKEEIENLDYIITSNKGNVKHRYKIKIYNVTKKSIKEDMKYLGNYEDILPPSDEYTKNSDVGCLYKYLEETIIYSINSLGTSSNPKWYDVNPENIDDSQIRFLIKEKYYEEKLGIKPREGADIPEDPLLFISLVDSIMIGGFVMNPVGKIGPKTKEKAYQCISELKEKVKDEKDKVKILEELEEKIRNFKQESFIDQILKKYS